MLTIFAGCYNQPWPSPLDPRDFTESTDWEELVGDPSKVIRVVSEDSPDELYDRIIERLLKADFEVAKAIDGYIETNAIFNRNAMLRLKLSIQENIVIITGDYGSEGNFKHISTDQELQWEAMHAFSSGLNGSLSYK